MQKRKLPFLFLLAFALTLVLVQNVYAPDEDINLENLPAQLAAAWGITEFAAGLFMSVLFIFPFMVSIAMLSAKMSGLILMFVGFGVMGFCIAIGWLPYWIMILLSLLIASLWASKITGKL